MKKNCLNCKHLESHVEQMDSDGYEIAELFNCDKQYNKMYERDKEDEFLGNIERPEYRAKSKVCFEPKYK